MGQLSAEGKKVLGALRALSPNEQAKIVAQAVVDLAGQVAAAAPAAASEKRTKAHVVLQQGVAEKLITKAGGIFIGERQLRELGLIEHSVTIPPVPEKFLKSFLTAAHPLRGGKMAEHIILGYEPKTKAWYCFEKSIVPGSLGAKGRRLSGPEQDKLLLDEHGQPKIVEGMKYTSPTDCRPIKDVLDSALHLLRTNGVTDDERLPFYGVYGRTADTQNAACGCRVLLGNSPRHGSCVNRSFSADYAFSDVGLLAGWS